MTKGLIFMTRSKGPVSKQSAKVVPTPEVLGPGLHGAKIEMRVGAKVRLRCLDGRRVMAVLADGLDARLADECLRSGRMVVACDGPWGPTVAGALQTELPVFREVNGTVVVDGKEIRLTAARRLVIEAGTSSLRLEHEGVVRAEGNRMVIDMGANVRVLSALVELP
jgi:hypothetical protein